VPTPLTYFAANTLPVDGLCMITGSHNPPEYNGFKVGIGKSTMAGPEVQALKKHVLAQPRPQKRKGRESEYDITTPYLHFVTQTLGKSARKLKVVVDPGNGTGAIVAPRLLRALGHQVIELFCDLDGTFPNHHPDPTVAENLKDLQDKVRAEGADLGVAFDGDADRALFICHDGQIVNGDGVMLAAARFLKAHDKLNGSRVVGTSMSNLGLERVLARENIVLARADVGDRYVLEEMLRSGSVLGGEQSGHIIFLDDSPAGDGLLTALKIASLVSMHGALTNLTSGLKDYPQTIVNVKVRSKPPLDSLPDVARALFEAQSALGESGRVVLRYSGTEPLARVMVEAEHDADVQRYSQSVANALRSSIGV
jgi:phosphoglucosamine mutase